MTVILCAISFAAGGSLIWFCKDKIQTLVIGANALSAKLRAKADAVQEAGQEQAAAADHLRDALAAQARATDALRRALREQDDVLGQFLVPDLPDR